MTEDINLYAALRAGFPEDLDAVAVETDGGVHTTWRELEQGSARVANLLDGLALPAGARVAVQVEKSVEALLLYLATLRAGLVFLPLNTAYQNAEMAYFIGDAEPAVLVCAPQRFDGLQPIAAQTGTVHVFTLDEEGRGSLMQRAAGCADTHRVVERRADDMAAILYTSGTTGRSKGAMLSHGNLLSNARVLFDYWGWRRPDAHGAGGDVLVHALPIFHVHGLFVAIHGALLAGAKMLWQGRFDAVRAVQWLPRATVFMGVPTLYVRLLQEAGLTREATAGMRLFISGSAPLLIDTFCDWQQRTGHTILERYGMSETLMLTSNPYRPEQGERRGGTVGYPLPGVALRIAQDGEAVAGDAIGGIEVRGPNVFFGYWRMPEKTAQEFTADGWFRTGDVGCIDDLGHVRIVGRSKDLIISGGYNVYPAEIEGVLNEMAGVAESAVVGVPHPDFGEVGVALLIPRPGEVPDVDAIAAALKQRLANFKLPKRYFIVDGFPRNAMGKVQKNVLREQHKALFAAAT